MKIVQINSHCGSGSTGKICVAVSQLLTEYGIENYILYSAGNSEYPLGKRYMSGVETKAQTLKSRILGNYGFNSQSATKRIIRMLEQIQPDIVHLHNLHGHNCNLQMLFSYLKAKKIKIYWTFHDCWAFTGYCPYYDIVECANWKDGCRECPQRKKYSWFFDRSHYLFRKKKELYGDLDLTVVTPSKWLAEQVKQSFLHKVDLKVIYNGIDLNIFQPCESNFRDIYHCKNQYLVLGVAFAWCERKGLDIFLELAKRLDDRFRIVMVGTDERLSAQLPGNVISLSRTHNQKELAEIYTTVDVFVNPTRDEVLGLTNLEALACGTPVITFDTGGSPECIDETCGVAVPKNDVDAVVREIMEICVKGKFKTKGRYDYVNKFDADHIYEEYINLYK